MFLKTRQVAEAPEWFLPQGIIELEEAVENGRDLPAMRIVDALEQAGIPLSEWDGVPLDRR
jgi:hypothetical protein